MEEKTIDLVQNDKVQDLSGSTMTKAGRLAMELSNEKKRLKLELQELQAEYEEVKPTRIVELVISEENESLAIDAISLVASPAIEQDMVYFGKEKNNLTFAEQMKEVPDSFATIHFFRC